MTTNDIAEAHRRAFALVDFARIRAFYPIRYDWPTTIQRTIAYKMPRWLVYFVTIRAYSDAWAASGGKTPDELTFSDVVGPWEKPRKKGAAR